MLDYLYLGDDFIGTLRRTAPWDILENVFIIANKYFLTQLKESAEESLLDKLGMLDRWNCTSTATRIHWVEWFGRLWSSSYPECERLKKGILHQLAGIYNQVLEFQEFQDLLATNKDFMLALSRVVIKEKYPIFDNEQEGRDR